MNMKIRTLIALIGSGLNALGFTILMVSNTWFACFLLATGSAGILLYFLFNFLDENKKSQPQQPQLQQQQQQWQQPQQPSGYQPVQQPPQYNNPNPYRQ